MDDYPRVRDCMKKGVVSIGVHASLEEAVALVVKKKIGTLPVLDSAGHLVGVTTLHDIMQNFLPDFVDLLGDIDFVKDFGAVKAPSQERLKKVAALSVADIMEEPVAVESDSSLVKSLSMLEKHGMWDLPVVDGGKLVGIASRVDIVRAFFLEWQIPHLDDTKE